MIDGVYDTAEVAVVGGGPTGLAAAVELRRRGAGRVVVLEREPELGGVPRHCQHTGYGVRDLHRLLSGPAYARRWTALARDAGVELWAETTATGWAGPTDLDVTAPGGRRRLSTRAVVLAGGCRERPRSARLVPGTRPAGVFTTGSLQQHVFLEGRKVGSRAVIVGAEHVSFSAVLTLAHRGTRTVAMVTDAPRHQTYPPLLWATAGIRSVPVLSGYVVGRVLGRRRVEGVEIRDADGASRVLDCDTLIFTGDWVPDHELARLGGTEVDPASGSPVVDARGRTSRPDVFAAGNLVHPAETADVAALGGEHVAAGVADRLAGASWPDRPGGRHRSSEPDEGARIRGIDPVRWVFPGVVRTGEAVPYGHVLLRVARTVTSPRVTVRQGGRVLWSRRRPGRLVPNRSIHIPSGWVDRIVPSGDEVQVQVTG